MGKARVSALEQPGAWHGIRLDLGCLILACLVALGCDAAEDTPVFDVEILNIFPHDRNAFTQGLTISEGKLYEGTGRNGQSSLRLVELESGQIARRHNLSDRYFGEGIAILGDRLYQLTWRSHSVFIYDRDTFEVRDSFYLPGEGWGITHDGSRLIISDGSAVLRFLDPETHNEVGRIQVYDENGPVARLNELEFIEGEVWANVWYQDHIVRIDPETGRVNSRVNLVGLYATRNTEEVLNGIAWDAESRRLFVTGKLWPNLFEIQVME